MSARIHTSDNGALISYLKSILPQDGSRDALTHSVLPTLLESIADIADAFRSSHTVSAAGTANEFGDDQLNVDVTAENLIRAAVSRCPSIATASSEEDPVERPVTHTATSPTPFSSEQYTLAFDPLDGSSIIPANWTVGTILSLWDGASALNQPPSTRQIGAILGIYGPRTTAIVALRISSPSSSSSSSPAVETCFELAYDPCTSSWLLTRPHLTLSPQTTYFAPANLRAAAHDAAYHALVAGYIARQHTLRYSGGLVPDVVHMLVQGQGIYLSPVVNEEGKKGKAKLRRLYEVCPLALVVECAGGKAVDPVDGGRVLERSVGGCSEKGGIVCGSGGSVEEAIGGLVG